MRKAISQQMSFGDGFIDAEFVPVGRGAQESRRASEAMAKLLKPFEEVFDESMGRPGTAGGDLSSDDVSEVSLGAELRRSGDRG